MKRGMIAMSIIVIAVIAIFINRASVYSFARDQLSNWFTLRTQSLGNTNSANAPPKPETLSKGTKKPRETSARELPPRTIAAIKSVRTYGDALKSLNGPLELLTHDELSLRIFLTNQCNNLSFLRDGERGLAKRFLNAPVGENQKRVDAARMLATACDQVPESMLGIAALSALQTEIARRTDHPMTAAMTLPMLAKLGGIPNAVATVFKAGDVLAVESVLSVVEIGEQRKPADQQTASPETTALRQAWELAMCDLAGGCERDSLPMLLGCVYRNQCDASSLRELYRAQNPDQFTQLDQTRQRMSDSFRSGDWSWLDFSKFRSTAEINEVTKEK
jgi:hypothetical protein